MRDFIEEYIREISSIIVSMIVATIIVLNIDLNTDTDNIILVLTVLPLFVGLIHYGVTKIVEIC